MARPAFKPTAEQRRLVYDLAARTVTEDEIRVIVPWGQPKPIDAKTLRKHFADELERGHAMSHARVKRKLHQLIDEGNVAAVIFYCKARLGWSEKVQVEASGPNGVPLPAVNVGPVLYLPAKDDSANAPPRMPPAAVEAAAPTTPDRPARPHWRQVLGDPPDPAPQAAVGNLSPGALARGAVAADPRHP